MGASFWETITKQVQAMVDSGLICDAEKERLIRKYTENLEASSHASAGNVSGTDTAECSPSEYTSASEAELEQRLECQVPIGKHADSALKWLEQFANEAQKTQPGASGMSKEQERAVQELLGLGFSEAASKAMIRFNRLLLPLGEAIFKNAQLLKLYVDIHAFSADKPDPYSVASFLSHAPEKNAYMAQIPQRYSFSEEERQSYFSDPLRWTIDYDLREQLGEALFDLFGDRERVERLMCRMYCSGHFLQPPAKIQEDIAALLSLNPDPKELRELVEEEWTFLFTFYKDTAKTISILSDIFLKEYVWMIFSKECVWLTGAVRDAGSEYFDQFPASLVQLKKRYHQYLKEQK